MRNSVASKRFRVVVMTLAAVMVMTVAAPALAKRDKPGKPNGAEPTLTVTPAGDASLLLRDGAMPYGEMVVSGTDFRKETAIFVKFWPSDTGYLTDTDGTSFSFTWMPPAPGDHTIEAWQVNKRNKWEKVTEIQISIAE